MNKIIKGMRNPSKVLPWILVKCAPLIKNDKTYLRWNYCLNMHRCLNLQAPKTYNEKLQWLKIYDRNPVYTTMVDKLKVKQYVSERIGAEHVIKTLGVWKSVEEIEWEKLPNRFVMKTTQAGGNIGVIICRDKSKLDIKNAGDNLKKGLAYNLYIRSREWPYKNVETMIFAEEYMEDEYGELRDYKFFCFDGKVKALFVATDRQKRVEPYFNFFDEKYNPLQVKQGHPVNPNIPEKPYGFDEMVRIAEKLSIGIPHVRIDLYDINGTIYFGEFTFYHFGGVVPFEPADWDYKFGSWLNLPNLE